METIDFYDLLQQMGMGLLSTVQIFVWTLVLSLPLGLAVAFGRMSGNIIVRSVFKVYISVMRGTPLMLQLIAWYFGGYYLFEFNLPPQLVAIVVGFTLNYAAYFGEIYRSGIESTPKGQYEAARIMGYTKTQAFMKIILPQMFKRVMPSITNEVITLLKDTSLAFAISYTEMFTIASQISSAQTTFMPLVVAGVFYYIFNFIVAFIMERIEKRLNYYH